MAGNSGDEFPRRGRTGPDATTSLGNHPEQRAMEHSDVPREPVCLRADRAVLG
jgi:hypothetical protein